MPVVVQDPAAPPPPPPLPAQAPLPPLPPADALPGPLHSPADVLRAMQARRDMVRDQIRELEEKREEITEQMVEHRNQGLNTSGLEGRMRVIDDRINDMERQLAIADMDAVNAAAVPGSTPADIPAPEYHRDGPPDGVFVVLTVFTLAVFMPIALAFARRIWKRTTSAVAAIPADVGDRLRAIEQAVESVALEVERIGEGQRFMSRVFTDRQSAEARALGEGAAAPIDVAQRAKVAEPR